MRCRPTVLDMNTHILYVPTNRDDRYPTVCEAAAMFVHINVRKPLNYWWWDASSWVLHYVHLFDLVRWFCLGFLVMASRPVSTGYPPFLCWCRCWQESCPREHERYLVLPSPMNHQTFPGIPNHASSPNIDYVEWNYDFKPHTLPSTKISTARRKLVGWEERCPCACPPPPAIMDCLAFAILRASWAAGFEQGSFSFQTRKQQSLCGTASHRNCGCSNDCMHKCSHIACTRRSPTGERCFDCLLDSHMCTLVRSTDLAILMLALSCWLLV